MRRTSLILLAIGGLAACGGEGATEDANQLLSRTTVTFKDGQATVKEELITRAQQLQAFAAARAHRQDVANGLGSSQQAIESGNCSWFNADLFSGTLDGNGNPTGSEICFDGLDNNPGSVDLCNYYYLSPRRQWLPWCGNVRSYWNLLFGTRTAVLYSWPDGGTIHQETLAGGAANTSPTWSWDYTFLGIY